MAARENGVAVVVWRRGSRGVEVLLLHRSLFPAEYGGDWAWSGPGGRLDRDEDPQSAAARELQEETGLILRVEPVASKIAAGLRDTRVHVFEAEAALGAAVILSAEHDRYEWVSPAELSRCLPDWVHAMYEEVLGRVIASRDEPGT